MLTKLTTTALLAIGLSLPAAAQTGAPIQAERLEELMREAQIRQERARQEQRARAAERCVAQRGVDCTSDEGLREWMLLERTREEAVLDILRERSGNASFGGSAPAR